MPGRYENLITIEDAEILFLNFEGREDKYNRAGDRNFCVIIDEETVPDLIRDGWNIKTLSARDEGEPDRHYLQVAVGYKAYPPRVVLLTEAGNRTPLGEDSVGVLDQVDIKEVDLTIRPYEWEVNGEKGVKAYLKTIFVTIYQDPIEMKYDRMDQEDEG